MVQFFVEQSPRTGHKSTLYSPRCFWRERHHSIAKDSWHTCFSAHVDTAYWYLCMCFIGNSPMAILYTVHATCVIISMRVSLPPTFSVLGKMPTSTSISEIQELRRNERHKLLFVENVEDRSHFRDNFYDELRIQKESPSEIWRSWELRAIFLEFDGIFGILHVTKVFEE